MPDLDLDRLDDLTAIRELDVSDMLRAVATSAPQLRASRAAAADASLTRLDPDSRPRAVVVTGMGGSGIAGDVLTSLTSRSCPVPVVAYRGYGLPGWVGAADVVIALSCSGTTAETLSGAAEASRRGSRLLGVGTAGSPLADVCERANGGFIPVDKVLSPRSSLWALATPVLVVGARFGLLDLGPDDANLEAAAVRLEAIAAACNPDRESFVNRAKSTAIELVNTIPMIWGAGPIGPVTATRLACQLAENAKWPSASGGIPEVHHNQVVSFDGNLAGGSAADDIFRDRLDEPDPMRLRLVLLADTADDETVAKRIETSRAVAENRGVPVTELTAEGDSPVERLASLIGLIDYVSVYLAIALGVDPTPIGPIDELKRNL